MNLEFKPQELKNKEAVEFIVIDLFCGAGGTTTGFEQAVNKNGDRIAVIAACVNHSYKAIKSHWENHPEVYHFEEDIRTLNLDKLQEIATAYKMVYPKAKLILWASLECTNFSKAKGGQARDADSRTLADYLDRYVLALNPDYIQIENVVEFMSWGPLDDFGKPISTRYGEDWVRWKSSINLLGYTDEWKELNSADFGAYTSRNRLFGCFSRLGLKQSWPMPTHHKKAHNGLLKWKAVKDVLDFEDEGISIFARKKPLVENTLKRIYAGLIKHVAGGKDSFLYKYYGTGDNVESIEGPAGTITTKDRFAKIQCNTWLDKQYSGQHNHQSVEVPAGTIMTSDKHALVSAPFILNPSHGGHTMHTNQPCPVIIARQDKAPLYLVNYNQDPNVVIEIYEDDSETMIKIKEFMALYGISDIKMRMLKILELKTIQGFPLEYKLYGNQGDQKKHIGNSVAPVVVKEWAQAMNILNN